MGAQGDSMKLSVEALAEVGAFTGPPIEKEIKWKQGEDEFTATVFVRPLGYNSAVKEIRALSSNMDAIAQRIASSILDENGAPIFNAEDITGESNPERGPLNSELTMALLHAISEANTKGS